MVSILFDPIDPIPGDPYFLRESQGGALLDLGQFSDCKSVGERQWDKVGFFKNTKGKSNNIWTLIVHFRY